MKYRICATALLVACSVFTAVAQGVIEFKNSLQNPVTCDASAAAALGLSPNALVPLSPVFRVALYFAPTEGADPASMVKLAETGFVQPGLYDGGVVAVPLPGGRTGWFQVRAWELAYGNSYETAVLAGPIGGRQAIAGQGAVFSAIVSPSGPPPPTTLIAGFEVSVVPEPSAYALALLGAASCLLRFRRNRR